jgi:hypothetical protein
MRPPTAAPHLVSIARSHRLLLAYGRTWAIDLRLWRRRQLPLQLQGNNLTGSRLWLVVDSYSPAHRQERSGRQGERRVVLASRIRAPVGSSSSSRHSVDILAKSPGSATQEYSDIY